MSGDFARFRFTEFAQDSAGLRAIAVTRFKPLIFLRSFRDPPSLDEAALMAFRPLVISRRSIFTSIKSMGRPHR
jgi:hypothetical protein